MNSMITISLILNLAILVPVCTALLMDANWVEGAYGEKSPARAILMSVYIAILLLSCVLLYWREPSAVVTLLLLQIVYKGITPIAVGTIMHPVVATNLFVVGVHTVTLATIWMSVSR